MFSYILIILEAIADGIFIIWVIINIWNGNAQPEEAYFNMNSL